jgi:hypothetical protein
MISLKAESSDSTVVSSELEPTLKSNVSEVSLGSKDLANCSSISLSCSSISGFSVLSLPLSTPKEISLEAISSVIS